MKQEIPWNRFFVEAIIIVGSILLAFGIQAWWDDRENRNTERAILDSLLSDLTGKQSLLSDDAIFSEAVLESASTLLRLAAAGTGNTNTYELERLLFDTIWYNSEGEWASAPLEALFSSGDSSDITNPLLVQKLSEIHISISNLRAEYRRDEEFHHEVLLPFFLEYSNFAQITSNYNHVPGLPHQSYTFPSVEFRNTQNYDRLLELPRFQGILAAKINRIEAITRMGYAGLDDQLSEVTQLIRDELEN